MIAKALIRRLLLASAFLALCFATTIAVAQAVAAVGTGYVDSADYLPAKRQLVVSGWAAPEKPNVFATNLVLSLGGREIYRGRMERSERPDVVSSSGRRDWLWSGFSVRVAVPDGIVAGSQPLSARMHLGDGTEFELRIAPTASLIQVTADAPRSSFAAELALLLAIALPLLVLLGSLRTPPPTVTPKPPLAPAFFAITLGFSFALLVAAGWTGSSLGLSLDHRGITEHDETDWFGEQRPVRSDEWEVLTPLAISQANHQPAFPVTNRNLGLDGSNMLVVGMTGVPVAHISSLAKPATWGFFLFDLRRGLAWSWWFPFFGCFAAVWMLLRRCFALEWRIAAGLAITVSASPYSVVFSGWPAYAVFFPAAGLLAANAVLRTQSCKSASVLGALLGLAVAGFALVLYPAWQISLAYLLVPFGLAWFVVSRKELRWGAPQTAAATVALALAGLLLSCWWVDAREAVASIRGTVYPGQRSIEVGGDIDRWFLAKGLLSPMTMERASSLMFGASDAGSVVLFLVPLLVAVLFRLVRACRIDAVAATLCGSLALMLWFMFVGFWAPLSRFSLWGSTTSYRMDLALGLVQVLLLAWLASPASRRKWNAVPASGRGAAGAVALVAVAHVVVLYRLVPPPILETVPASFIALSLMAIAAAAYLLMRERHAGFLWIYATWTLIASVPFNPLGQAPRSVTPAAEIADALSRSPSGKRASVAVLGERDWAMALPAAGIPVVNSVFYYPQASLWPRLDPDGRLAVVYNRYQRVLLVPAAMDTSAPYRIDSPRLDEVRVTLDPARFDFRLLGAQFLLAASRDADALRNNGTLQFTRATPEWTVFAVVP